MSNMKKIIGYCSSQLDEIPNLIRGLGGGEQGFSLPFSLTISQIVVMFTIIFAWFVYLTYNKWSIRLSA
ncbi:hypothetical protein [Staphylococcus aureus]|uniref:hypothetical protein n=1 Tax=Staphylococcus aureus TaxID=1280 RepID=UPI000DF968CA|nr:hypothetical protein [Staphylococcus aureus]SUL87613.1 Uncharacterised protein [Staphylococcus aureus]